MLALQRRGIGRGDRVAIYLPMRPETVVVLLACGWLGAIAVPLFSGYGPAAMAGRLAQTTAKALVTCESFHHAARPFGLSETAREGDGTL